MHSTEADIDASGVGTFDLRVEVPQRHGLASAFLATPAGTFWKSAALIVGDEPGINPSSRGLCRALALAGHAAMAVDLLALRASEGDIHAAWTTGVNASISLFRVRAPHPLRYGIVGFGLGGFVACLAAARCAIGSAIAFYGEGLAQLRAHLRILDVARPGAAPMLCFVGARDRSIPVDDLAVIRERLVKVRMPHSFVIYPGATSNFFFPGATEHDSEAAADAWKRLLHALETAKRSRYRFPSPTRTP
jgi:carboxymethylenebutenolidase